MGIIINWLGCTPEAAIIEFGMGTLIFFGWFLTMKYSLFIIRRKDNAIDYNNREG